jgi:hypothetical protein
MTLLAATTASAEVRLVAPGGVDAGNCVGSPCASLGHAYQVAAAGDVVQIAAGVYPAQVVPSGSKAVTFDGQPGNKLRKLDNFADNVIFNGLDLDANFATPETAVFENRGADNVTFKNGRIGNVTDQKGAVPSGANFTFDNVDFHDAVMSVSGTHMECVFAIGVPGMVVRNSTFRNCAVMGLFFVYGDWWSPLPPPYGNVTIENNVFEHVLNEDGSWNAYPLYIGGTGSQTLNGWVVRNNTFEQNASVGLNHSSGAVNSRWVGNLGGWDCVPGMVYRYNVGKKCGATDREVTPNENSRTTIAPFGWVAPRSGNFKLSPGSVAIGAADPTDHPATDREGNLRGDVADAGALEYGIVSPPAAGGVPGTGRGKQAPRSRWIRSVRLQPGVICKRPRRRCPKLARLTVKLNRSAKLKVLVNRRPGKGKLRRGKGKVRRLRALTAKPRGSKGLVRTARIRARGLRRGRYRVLVRVDRALAPAAKGVRVRLRVR